MDIALYIKAIILGIVEGLTEFLPVSSTGHLIIFQNLIDFSTHSDFANMFAMVIQLGAILAVVVVYWQKIWESIVHLLPTKSRPLEKTGLYFWLMILISCVPAAAIGIPFDDLIEAKLFNPLVVACALFIGGFWMLYAESKVRCNHTTTLDDTYITPKMALIVGLFQVLSIVPGMSRSASTIIGGWFAGFSTVAGAEYSFFLAIPVMFGQALLNILDAQGCLSSTEWIALGIGFLVSFMVALAVIGSFIAYLQKKPMKVFAIYRIIFAFVVLGCGVVGLF